METIYIKHYVDEDSNSLTHYGVKGMKWKRRRKNLSGDIIRATTGKSKEYWEELSSNSGKRTLPQQFNDRRKEYSRKQQNSKGKNKVNQVSKKAKKVKAKTSKFKKLKNKGVSIINKIRRRK